MSKSNDKPVAKLTENQEALLKAITQELRRETALAYIRNGYTNKTKSYLDACEGMGRKPSKNPETSACEILGYPNVIEFLDSVKLAIAEEVQIDAAWVLRSAKKVFDRCMQYEPITSRDGSPVMVKTEAGELVAAYKFDSTGANKALDTVGKHVDVRAFEKERDTSSADSLADSVSKLIDKLPS